LSKAKKLAAQASTGLIKHLHIKSILKPLAACTANNFGFMYSRKRISQKSFPKFIYIYPKSFMIFCQELLDAATMPWPLEEFNPKRNNENQI
jgi:hypothetical protein